MTTHAPRRLLVVLLLLALGCAAPASAERRLVCSTIPKLIDTYLQTHLRFSRLDDEIRTRAAETYLNSLDPSKTLFLESEAKQFVSAANEMFEEIHDDNCTRLHSLQTRALSRHQANEAFVRKFVSRDDFEIDEKLELVIDPDKRGYPKNPEEQRSLYRRLVQFQISNFLVEGTEMDKAKERLIHRYELLTKRAAEVESEDIYAAFLNAFAHGLDPHSSYFSADALEDFEIGMQLSLEGIGVGLSSRDGYPVVEEIIPGGATDRAKALKPKDKIISVAEDGDEFVSVVDMALRDVVRLIRGKKGTVVRLTVLREEDITKRFTVKITRDTIDLKEQAATLRFEEREANGRKLKLAVIELRSFYGDKDPGKRRSIDDMTKLLKEVRAAEADGLLLDLSRNGGGNLEYAVSVSGLFVESGGIVAIRESSGRQKVLRDPDDDIRYDGPLVVLTSRISASASEILAGALKDYGRAVIVGDQQTFGKGTVQTVIPLGRGLGALKVTTAMFFRPGGLSTQQKGVEPHIMIPSPFDREQFGERHQEYSLPGQTTIPFMAPKARYGDGTWKPPLRDPLVKNLASRSKERVSDSEDFDEVLEKLAEAEKNEGVVRLAEILEQKQEADESSEADTAADDSPEPGATQAPAAGDAAIPPHGDAMAQTDEELSLQAEESLNILMDLITLGG